MSRPVIIACAVTGSADTKGINPSVPVTPKEIADEVIAASKAGAAIGHIHVRDIKTGKASMEVGLYKEVVDRVRDSGCKIIINLTTGPGGRFVPSANDPSQAGPGSSMKTPEQRVEHVQLCKPDICSLDVATMNFGDRPMVNSPEILNRMATLIEEAGVKPELEVFDTGHVRLAAHMIEKGVIKDRKPLFQLCLGIPWGAPATPEAMSLMKSLVPSHGVWASFGISRTEFPMVAAATVLGGHVRVGLEDNLYIARGELAKGNAQLVERAAEIVNSVGERPATVAEARELLGLRAA